MKVLARKPDTKPKSKTKMRTFKNPFFNFINKIREEMKGRNYRSKEIFEMAGQRWRSMNAEQRKPYVDQAKNARRTKRSIATKLRYRKNQNKDKSGSGVGEMIKMPGNMDITSDSKSNASSASS